MAALQFIYIYIYSLPLVSVLVHTLEASLSTEGHFSGHKDNARELQRNTIILASPRVLYHLIVHSVTKTI